MKIFISGGCKNGKSYYAQHCAKHLAKVQQANDLYYVATMQPVDSEDDQRIARHIEERTGWGFVTIEQPVDIESILHTCDPDGSFLLDSLTALLANEMFPLDGCVNEKAAEKIIGGLSQIFKKVNNIILVSDFIYSDAVIYDQLTEKYRQSLADIDKRLAKECDILLEAAYTQVIVHKGEDLFHEISGKID